MREIKFRGRENDKRYGLRWVYGDLTHSFGSVLVAGRIVEEFSVGQFTGLRDADGREIYEGDIVRCKHDDWAEEDAEIYAVRYFDDLDYPAFELDGWEDGECNGIAYFKVCGGIYVIGNVHDNPNLLEVAHD